MFVSFVCPCCVGRGLWDGLITRPEECYLVCVCVSNCMCGVCLIVFVSNCVCVQLCVCV